MPTEIAAHALGDRVLLDRTCLHEAADARRAARGSPRRSTRCGCRRRPAARRSRRSTWRSPSARMSVTARSERPMSRWISCVRPDSLPLRRLAFDALGRRAREHRVLGRDPALAAAPHPARHVLVDRRGAQHPGAAERHQRRPGRHLGVVALERDRSQLVHRAAIRSGHACSSASSRGERLAGHRDADPTTEFLGRLILVTPRIRGRPEVGDHQLPHTRASLAEMPACRADRCGALPSVSTSNVASHTARSASWPSASSDHSGPVSAE